MLFLAGNVKCEYTVPMHRGAVYHCPLRNIIKRFSKWQELGDLQELEEFPENSRTENVVKGPKD